MRLLLIGLAATGAGVAEAQQAAPQLPAWIVKMEECGDRRRPAVERVATCTQAAEIAFNFDTQENRQPKASALFHRSDARLETGDFDGAIADADEADRIVPDNAEILNGRCWTRAVANRELDLARGACDLSLAKQMTPAALDSRALVSMREGKWQEALTDYDEAFSLNPAMTVSLYGRGLAALALGRSTEAEFDMRRAATAAPEFARYGLTPQAVKARAEAAN